MAGPSMPALPLEGVCPLSTREVIERILLATQEASARKLYGYQRKLAKRIVESLLRNDGATITALFSRQSGKSETIAVLGVGLPIVLPALAREFPNDKRFKVFANGFLMGIFAPTNRHSGIIYARIRDRVQTEDFAAFLADPELNVAFTHSRGDSFSYSNGSMVQAFTASETVLNEGFTYHLVVTDESQKFSTKKITKELRPMLASYNGTMVEIGTAFMARCQFHDDIKHNIKVEKEGGPRNHFQFDYTQVIADRRTMYTVDGNPAHLAYEKFVTSEIARLGGLAHAQDDESFRMNFMLRWEESFQNALNMTHFLALGNEDIEEGHQYSGGRFVAGLDIAKTSDSTWLTVGWVDTARPVLDTTQWAEDSSDDPAVYYHVTIVGWCVLQGNFESDLKGYGQYDRLISFLRMFPRIDSIYVDSTSMGDPVYERMRVLLPNVSVNPYHYSLASKHALYRWYFQEIAARRFHFCAGPETRKTERYAEFVKQHEGLVRTYSGQYLQVFAGDEDNGHDDAPDSAAMMLWASKNEGIPMVDFASDGGSAVDMGGSSHPLSRGRGSRYSSRY